MSVLDDEPAAPATSRLGRKLLLLAGVIAAAIAVWVTWRGDASPPAPPPAASAPRAAAAPKARKATTPDAPATAGAAATADRPAAADSPAAAPSATRTGVLRVRSDVPGASVFLDRQFLGTTPLDLDSLSPGSHRLNVSADGYEGRAQGVEIGDTPAEVEVRFKDVSVNASIPVVHKHAVGSCSGRLVADASGLRYETANAADAFNMGFGEVETFAVDYLKKNLRVKRRSGRTWNFEDPNGQADPLFVFHRDVEKARTRLAAK
jgi:hypothetical protein